MQRTSLFLAAMLFSMPFTAAADSASSFFTFAPEVVESCRPEQAKRYFALLMAPKSAHDVARPLPSSEGPITGQQHAAALLRCMSAGLTPLWFNAGVRKHANMLHRDIPIHGEAGCSGAHISDALLVLLLALRLVPLDLLLGLRLGLLQPVGLGCRCTTGCSFVKCPSIGGQKQRRGAPLFDLSSPCVWQSTRK